MSVYKDGANWQDRILNAYPPASDGERYYKLVRADGSTVEEAVKLELLNTVLPGNEGTPANAGNFNSILAAMGTAKKNYSNTKITEPYRDSLIGYMDFAGGLSPTVGTFTLTGTSVNQISGPHSNSKGYQGTGAASGITLNTKLIPRGAKTIRFRIYLAAATAQTLIDETNGSTANYGLYVTVNTSQIINFQIMNGGSAIVNINSAAIPLTTWTDVIFTWDGTTGAGRVRVYVNGSISAQGTATATQAALEPTNNTVLLNRAPISTAGGTAAISEIEVYNEAIYADAYVLEQKGFSLFDGAKVRIKWGFSLANTYEALLNINNSGNVPVAIGTITANSWTDLIYNSSTKKFELDVTSGIIPLLSAVTGTSLSGRNMNIQQALQGLGTTLNTLDGRIDDGVMGKFRACCIWKQTTTVSANGFIPFTSKVKEDISGVLATSGRITIPSSLGTRLALLFVRGGVLTTSATGTSSTYYANVYFSKNGSTSNPWRTSDGGEQRGWPQAIAQKSHSSNYDYATSYMWQDAGEDYYYSLRGGRVTQNDGYTYTYKDTRGCILQVDVGDYFQVYFAKTSPLSANIKNLEFGIIFLS